MHRRIVLTLLAVFALIACGEARKSETASAETPRCTRCHGGLDNQTGAPPGSLRGEGKDGSTSAMGVGAHSAHVQGGKLARAFDCTACHPDPRAGATHLDGKVELALDGFAHEPVAAATAPGFVRATGTCASVYCHGAFRGGNGANAPVWTQVGTGQAACGSCHGAPPPPPHPASTDCGRCHSGYAAGSVNLATHVNGRIDLDGLACTSCHGDPARAKNQAAPPLGAGGQTSSTERAVGAHEAHLDGASLGAPVACEACHEVPTSLGHANGVAELRFGALATVGGTFTASFDGATCATYCHGATLAAGGTNTAPRWTGGAGEATCGTCHGLPPPSPHPVVTGLDRCGACHPQTVNASDALIPASAGGKHLDGTLQSSGHGADWMNPASPEFHAFSANADLASCTSCHGAELDGGTVQVSCGRCHDVFPEIVTSWRSNCVMCHGKGDNRTGAPPRTTWGRGADAVRVGAHTTHVTGSALAPAFDCGECHVKPTDALSPGHVDGATATVTFGVIATTSGAVPVWERTSATCASTYCHGATLSGGTKTRPVWTSVGTGEASCGSCHGTPPPAPHPANPDCARCHAGYTATSVNVATHVDGKLDLVGLSCSSCHGDPARAVAPAAPPLGTRGETSTTQRAVGAHQAHLTGTSLAVPVACTECHAVPTSPAHANGAVELTFGALATRRSTVPASFNGTNCSNYCHGASLDGGSVTAPVWTGDSSQAACGACHGLPPPSPHPTVTGGIAGCAGCHNGTVSASGAIIPAATGGKHLNGAVDGGCVGCHPLPANANYWHSGSHGGNPSANTCQVCHEDAVGLTSPGGVATDVTLSTATNCGPLRNQPCAASHNNGVVNVTPQWSNFCFNCHGE